MEPTVDRDRAGPVQGGPDGMSAAWDVSSTDGRPARSAHSTDRAAKQPGRTGRGWSRRHRSGDKNLKAALELEFQVRVSPSHRRHGAGHGPARGLRPVNKPRTARPQSPLPALAALRRGSKNAASARAPPPPLPTWTPGRPRRPRRPRPGSPRPAGPQGTKGRLGSTGLLPNNPD